MIYGALLYLQAGLTDEVLAEGEPALDAILNKVRRNLVRADHRA